MLKKILNEPATWLLSAAFVLAAAVGAIVVIVQPTTLSFADYLAQLSKFGLALGVLGVGRGIHAASKVAHTPTLVPDKFFATSAELGLSDEPDGDEDCMPHIEVSDPKQIPFDLGEEQKLLPAEIAALTASPANGSVSGLSALHRKVVRAAILHALNLSVANSSKIGYTESSPPRWAWFTEKIYAALGKFPTALDCSAWATWILYQGLRLFHVRDLINGEHWGGGFTGTMLAHGKLVAHRANVKLGDLAIYNGHVAVCIGGGYVLSHGSLGIHKLEIDYRSDLICIRRYI